MLSDNRVQVPSHHFQHTSTKDIGWKGGDIMLNKIIMLLLAFAIVVIALKVKL